MKRRRMEGCGENENDTRMSHPCAPHSSPFVEQDPFRVHHRVSYENTQMRVPLGSRNLYASFGNLPRELSTMIFDMLSIKDAYSCCLVSREWNETIGQLDERYIKEKMMMYLKYGIVSRFSGKVIEPYSTKMAPCDLSELIYLSIESVLDDVMSHRDTRYTLFLKVKNARSQHPTHHVYNFLRKDELRKVRRVADLTVQKSHHQVGYTIHVKFHPFDPSDEYLQRCMKMIQVIVMYTDVPVILYLGNKHLVGNIP